jgi:hypothetical protein
MFEHLSQYRTIFVAGPQRSGTRVASLMIAHDTGHERVDEGDFSVDDLIAFEEKVSLPNVVIHCPAMTHIVHKYSEPDVAIVYMRRRMRDIIASERRMSWGYERQELGKYGPNAKPPIALYRLKHWMKYQAQHVHNLYMVRYEHLVNHLLWVDRADRVEWRPDQMEIEA